MLTSIPKNQFPVYNDLDIKNYSKRQKVVSENIINQINLNFYVDGFVNSDSSTERLLSKVLSSGDFRLTKWLSNNKLFLDTLPCSKTSPKISENQVQIGKVQGILWNSETDLPSMKHINKVFKGTKKMNFSIY